VVGGRISKNEGRRWPRTHLCQNLGQTALGLLEKGLEQSYFLNEYNGTYLCKGHFPVAQFPQFRFYDLPVGVL